MRLLTSAPGLQDNMHAQWRLTAKSAPAMGAGRHRGDRSFDRNEQHRATLQHSLANVAFPRRGTPHRFGDEVGTVVIFLRHAETAASPRGGVQGWTAYLAHHPSA
jgi:hypothetical protein